MPAVTITTCDGCGYVNGNLGDASKKKCPREIESTYMFREYSYFCTTCWARAIAAAKNAPPPADTAELDAARAEIQVLQDAEKRRAAELLVHLKERDEARMCRGVLRDELEQARTRIEVLQAAVNAAAGEVRSLKAWNEQREAERATMFAERQKFLDSAAERGLKIASLTSKSNRLEVECGNLRDMLRGAIKVARTPGNKMTLVQERELAWAETHASTEDK